MRQRERFEKNRESRKKKEACSADVLLERVSFASL